MPERDDLLHIDDILGAICQIQEYTADLDYQTFVKDRKTQDAVIRNLEIIGEAAGRLSESVQAAISGIDWRKIIGLRNILIHEYFGISLPVVWDVIQTKLDPLEKACKGWFEQTNPDKQTR